MDLTPRQQAELLRQLIERREEFRETDPNLYTMVCEVAPYMTRLYEAWDRAQANDTTLEEVEAIAAEVTPHLQALTALRQWRSTRSH